MDSTIAPPDQDTRIKVMIVYADSLTRSRVMQIYQGLHRKLWQEFDFSATWWKFDYFAHPQIAEAATDTFVHADVVLLATKGGSDLPPLIKSWIDSWPRRSKEQGGALLALQELSDRPAPVSSGIQNYLRQAAQRTNMDYLQNYSPEGAQQEERTAGTAGRVSPETNRSTTRSNPVQHWGLNE